MKNAIKIIRTLRQKGFTALLVGGSVRDLLLKRPVKDIDIATDARPTEIEQIFPQTIAVGKQFGVMIVILAGRQYEVATFRADMEYADGRRPSRIIYSTPQEDAQRRDFTINGIFYDPIHKQFLDFINGRSDIRKRVIRFIGDAEQRINEDYLRILRAIRLKNQLGFDYAPDTLKAIIDNRAKIANVSSERIRDELNLMFLDISRLRALKELSSFGLLKYIIPELEALKGLPQPAIFHQEGDVFIHTLLSFQMIGLKESPHVIWATLLHDIGKKEAITFPKNKEDRIRFNKHAYYSASQAERILRRLKFDKIFIQSVIWLIEKHMSLLQILEMRPAKRQILFNNPLFPDLIKLAYYDAMGMIPQNIDFIVEIQKLYQKEYQPIAKPIITGKDLIALGAQPGPKIKQILDELWHLQIEGQIKNKKQGLEKARQLVEKYSQLG